jgi:SPP1 family predicted phage head-tail adaptor
MDSRALNEVITLQQRVPGLDGLGQESDQWQNVTNTPKVWARARPVRSSERFAAGQIQETTDIVFETRYRSDILPTWRVLWRGRPYEITGEPVDVLGRKDRIEIPCIGGIRGGQ